MELFSLTKPQKSIWNMEQYYGKSVANITGSVIFQTAVDIAALQIALNKTIEQSDSLRIRLKQHDGDVFQYIEEYQPQVFEFLRFSDRTEFEKWIYEVAETPFDLTGCLHKMFIFEVSNRIGFALHCHHTTGDAWTLNLITNRIIQNLNNETASKIYSYLDYLDTEREYESSARYEKDRAYFLSNFEKCCEPVYISDKQSKKFFCNRLSFTIGTDDTHKIQEFCKQNSITPFTMFMNTLAAYLFRIKGSSDVYIGTTVLNRAGKKDKETAGMYINTVPVLLHMNDDKSVLDNMRCNAESISSVFSHQRYQYVDMLKDIRDKYDFKDRLYDVILSFQNAAVSDTEIETNWHFCGVQGESLIIHINDRNNSGMFNLDYDYQTELFSEKEIVRLHRHLLNLIVDTIETPDKKPQDIKMLSDSEYKKIVFDFNDTAADYPKDKCIHQLFEEQVERTPDNIAVIFEDKQYTYRQINEMANSLAHILRDKGIGREDIVAIISKRSYKVIVAQFAVLKAGAAYLPIDPTYPQERIEFMLSDSNCKVALIFGTEVNDIDTIDLESFNGSDDKNIENVNISDDLCYCIYTSGSTGNPKGTLISHKNVVNCCNINDKDVVQKAYLKQTSIIVSVSTISFDVFVTESLLPLINGFAVILANKEQQINQIELNNLVTKNDVSIIQTTPTKIQMLMCDKNKLGYLKNLKAIILGGEALDVKTVREIRQHTDATIINAYGPTEATVYSTAYNVICDDITIGKPLKTHKYIYLTNI